MRTYLLLLAVTATGCHWALNDPGTDPEPAQLYFPTGIVVDPSHRFAYVTNGNADLRYGGGTVQMIDLLRVECAISTLRSFYGLSPIPLPAECAAHGPGSGDDWTNDTDPANHKWCQQDPTDETIVDCDETPFIVENQTVKVGNFAGDIVMQLDPPGAIAPNPTTNDLEFNYGPLHRRLFTAVRGDPSVTYLDLNLPATVMPTSQFPVATGRTVSCFDNNASVATIDGVDATNKIVTKPPGCDQDFLVQRDRCDQYPFCLAGKDGQGEAQLPTEPFGMVINAQLTTITDPRTGQSVPTYSPNRLLVSSLDTGQVSILDISGFPKLVASSPAFFVPDAQGQHGAFAMAARTPGDPASLWYLSSNIASSLDTFRVAAADLIVPGDSVPFNTTFILGDDFRDIQFDPTGDRAFITGNAPPALITLDTHIEPAPGGDQPANVVSSVIDICQTPSHMKIRRLLKAGAPGESTLVKTAILVVCFLSSQIM
ncbi:MAG TPA: hypothetical protein VIA18_03630, partial [Polyangia bacterium]|nr:hypothetical protein [Polyangia bacterium]